MHRLQVVLISIVLLLFSGELVNGTPPDYVEKHFDQRLDHFNFVTYGDKTFKQRYLIQDKWWNQGKGPIFFYTGNEGPITAFWQATGFVFDIAPQFGALVVFAEHEMSLREVGAIGTEVVQNLLKELCPLELSKFIKICNILKVDSQVMASAGGAFVYKDEIAVFFAILSRQAWILCSILLLILLSIYQKMLI